MKLIIADKNCLRTYRTRKSAAFYSQKRCILLAKALQVDAKQQKCNLT